MRLWRLSCAIAIAIAACVLIGCAKSRGPSAGSSETHFLLRCSDESCGDGLRCICGACSKACTSDTTCSELSSGASCVEPATDSCDEVRSCDVECKVNADCAQLSGQHACAQGRCRAPEATTNPDDSNPSKPADPDLAYGACTADNATCPSPRDLSGGCICPLFCDAASDCPTPATGTSVPKCLAGDVRVNGHSGRCELPCDQGETCPDGAACTGGVCRFGGEPATCTEPNCSDAGATPSPTSCALIDVAVSLSSAPLRDCGQLAIGVATKEQTLAVDCVRNAVQAGQPFSLLWQNQGRDSELHAGVVGVTYQGQLLVYSLMSDSFPGPHSNWSLCATFSILDACNQVPVSPTDRLGCLQCDIAGSQVCTCSESQKTTAPSVKCEGVPTETPSTSVNSPGVSVEPCGNTSCVFDGVCYPNGATSEDGCCTCDSAGGSCIEPGWCPGWILIGKRCASDADCSLQPTTKSGLICRTDFFGERGVCTRDCDFGCPTGTECVAEVPDYNGGTVANVCMRMCTTQAECNDEPSGRASLGSSCETHEGLTRKYCF